MSKFNLAFLFLILLAAAMLIGGIIRNGSADEALAGEQSEGLSTGLLASPLIYVGLLLLALAFGWRKFGRN
ncbi:MAG: hypothetical protein WA952_19915 [Lewinella sp.]